MGQGFDCLRSHLGMNKLQLGEIVEQTAGDQRDQIHLGLARREEIEAIVLEDQ